MRREMQLEHGASPAAHRSFRDLRKAARDGSLTRHILMLLRLLGHYANENSMEMKMMKKKKKKDIWMLTDDRSNE